MTSKIRYQLKSVSGEGWTNCTRASEVMKDGKRNGWLHWEIRTKDATSSGLARPDTWRKVVTNG